ncbi:MAG: hypothetical protein WDM80_15930 [Limisphaerales bacterium]
MDVRLIANEVKGGDFLAGLKRHFRPGNDYTAAMVAAHHIHCDSHR